MLRWAGGWEVFGSGFGPVNGMLSDWSSRGDILSLSLACRIQIGRTKDWEEFVSGDSRSSSSGDRVRRQGPCGSCGASLSIGPGRDRGWCWSGARGLRFRPHRLCRGPSVPGRARVVGFFPGAGLGTSRGSAGFGPFVGGGSSQSFGTHFRRDGGGGGRGRGILFLWGSEG